MQRQGMVQDVYLESQALNRSMGVRIITPPDYSPVAEAPYPILYFLHPWGLSPRYITDKLNIHRHLWTGIDKGTLPSFVVALPTGHKSFYVNPADPPGHDWTAWVQRKTKQHGDFFHDALQLYGQYGDYLLREAIPYVEANYHVRADRAGRAIGGISMGGAAAAVHAFRDSSRFCAVGIHSPAMFMGPPEEGGIPWIFGIDRESFAARNPADVARSLEPDTQPRIWMDIGDRDDMVRPFERLHSVLCERGIEHDYAVNPGGHDKKYWEPCMRKYLAFYARDWKNEGE